MTHYVQILPCIDEPGEYRAVCTCGWSARSDDKEKLRERAANHETEGIREPRLKREGFVSGLPDLDYP